MRTPRPLALCLALSISLLTLASCDRGSDSPADSANAKAANPALGARWQYPREREVNGRKVIVYAPQIRTWDEFKHFTAQVAVESTDPAAAVRYAVARPVGRHGRRSRHAAGAVAQPKVDRVTFSGGQGSVEHENRIRTVVESEPLEIPLDVFLYYLADGVLETPPPAGFNDTPPPIYVLESPAFLLFVNGEAVATAIGDSGLELIGNANFPVFRDTKSGTYYLLSGDYRYSSAKLAGPWGTIGELPSAFRKIPAQGEFATLAAVVATPPKSGAAPTIITTFKPAEIVVLDGKPRGREIAGTDGLESIVNTESPLFRLEGTYYLLVAGRWFSTKDLQRGPWKFTMPLPDAFARIPESDEDAEVRASVPGTLEARRAVLEAQVPETKTVKAGAAPDIAVAYAGGEAKFEPIPQTQVARAVNTANDIIQYGDKYYLCYEGMWYVADKPTGPWAATADVPAAVYEIPPSSPAYPVTQVIVNTNDDGEVESSYDGAYAAGMFIGFGVAYYGTGYYYPPYYYGGYYYPYYGGSYGHGSWYNPNTGGYGSRSVYYGPYGGYSYNQGYNPKTGRSSYVETAWDGDEWASSGGTYNPRTGISTDTDRHYSEDSNKMKMDRTIEGPGGREMDVKKTTDFDTGTRTTERNTSGGGSSEITRQRQAGGGYTTDGSIETAGGKSATISGEHERGKGSTTITGEGGASSTVDRERLDGGGVKREGEFTGQGGQSVSTDTVRQGDRSVTKAEGSGGGSAISASGGLGDRTTIAQSGSGDVYAGHDGNVYRKTDDGWQQHNDGGWSDVDVPDRPADGERPGLGEGGRREPPTAACRGTRSIRLAPTAGEPRTRRATAAAAAWNRAAAAMRTVIGHVAPGEPRRGQRRPTPTSNSTATRRRATAATRTTSGARRRDRAA